MSKLNEYIIEEEIMSNIALSLLFGFTILMISDEFLYPFLTLFTTLSIHDILKRRYGW